MKWKMDGDAIADQWARVIGSWTFILGQITVLTLWVCVNATSAAWRWDPPPYILLNLMLSFQAAFTGPVLLMAANRQADVDRRRAIENFLINVRDSQVLSEISEQVEDIHNLIEQDEEHW